MSPVIPYDIIALIIDIVAKRKDTHLLKELSLVSHSFLQICSQLIFVIVELHDGGTWSRWEVGSVTYSKEAFVNLLKSRPDVVNYICKLKYTLTHNNDDDHLLSPILLHLLPTFSRLNSLTITASGQDWNTLDTSLTSVFLGLMHLPTINHIELSYIQNFPLSSLTPCVNLHGLDMRGLECFDLVNEDSPEIVVEMIPKIRELHTSWSSQLTAMLHAKKQDGQPAFNFMDLRRFSMSFSRFRDERNIRYLLQNAKILEELHLSVFHGSSLAGILSPSASTLKVLDLTVSLYHMRNSTLPGGICEELEALEGHNMLEALSIEIYLSSDDTVDFIGSTIQKVENVLVKPGWPALRQVSVKFPLTYFTFPNNINLYVELQSLPDKYLSHLSKLELALLYSLYLFIFSFLQYVPFIIIIHP